MSVRNAGRRGLFGLLLAAPVAAVTSDAKAGRWPEGASVTVNLPPGMKAAVRSVDGRPEIDILVDTVERRMAQRIAGGRSSLGRTMEAAYALRPVGR